MDNQRKKLILAVGILVVAVACFFLFNRSNQVLSSKINYVCVATGERFTVPRDEVNTTPWRNPKTNEMTLFPVVERDGKLYVNAHYGQMIKTDPAIREVNKYVDPKTLEVRQQP